MRNIYLIVATVIVLTSLSGCFDSGHSHGDGGHSHDNTHQKHDSID